MLQGTGKIMWFMVNFVWLSRLARKNSRSMVTAPDLLQHQIIRLFWLTQLISPTVTITGSMLHKIFWENQNTQGRRKWGGQGGYGPTCPFVRGAKGGPSILGGPKCPLSSCLLLKLLCNPDANII